jgi:oligogalacturonide transport system substrate-binding protein
LFNFISGTFSEEPVKLKFSLWGNEARLKATKTVIDLYMKKNPDVSIEIESIESFNEYQEKYFQKQAGMLPDIMQVDEPWMFDFSTKDIFIDLNKYKTILDTTGFNSKFLAEHGVYNKKLLGLPTGINTDTFVVNTDLMIKMGIKTDIVWDWNNILENGTRIHKRYPAIYLVSLNLAHTLNLIKSYVVNKTGGKWINDDYTIGFDKKNVTDVFNYYLKLVNSGTVEPLEDIIPLKEAEYNPKWIYGNVILSVTWSSTVLNFQSPDFKLGVMKLPFSKNTNNTGIIVRPAQLLCINKKSANITEAIKFLNWFFSDVDAILVLGATRSVPATENGRRILTQKNILDKNINNAVIMGMLNAGKQESNLVYNSDINSIFSDIVVRIAAKKISPEHGAEELVSKTIAKLNELKAKK